MQRDCIHSWQKATGLTDVHGYPVSEKQRIVHLKGCKLALDPEVYGTFFWMEWR